MNLNTLNEIELNILTTAVLFACDMCYKLALYIENTDIDKHRQFSSSLQYK